MARDPQRVFTTLGKWDRWGAGPTIELVRRRDIRQFLDWVHEQAVADRGGDPGRTANKSREFLRSILLSPGAGTDRGAAPAPRAQGPARGRQPPRPDQGGNQRPLRG